MRRQLRDLANVLRPPAESTVDSGLLSSPDSNVEVTAILVEGLRTIAALALHNFPR